MFERILIKQNRISDNKIDLGKLCESLLFYSQTNFVLDRFTIEQFIRLVSIDKLKEYTERGLINLFIRDSAIGSAKFEYGSRNAFGPMITMGPSFNLEEYIHSSYLEITGSQAESNLKTQDFIDLCSPLKYEVNFQKVLESECEDLELLSSQLKIYVHSYLPQLDLTQLKVDIEKKIPTPFGTNVYLYSSNIDLSELTQKYSELLPVGHTLDWSGFLLRFIEGSGDINIAYQHECELFTDDYHTIFIQGRIDELIKRATKSSENIKTFESLALEKYKPIRDTINSGERTFDEFSKILDNSSKFRSWLSELDGNHALLNEYYDAITKNSWIDKKPIKAMRIGIFTGLGILGDLLSGGIPIGSLASAASDNYLLPRLAKGWKPNQFIDNDIKPFLPRKNGNS